MFNLGILTISDRSWRGQREDKSGQVIRNCMSLLNSYVTKYEIVPDEVDTISSKLSEWASEVDIILTTGGTGLGARDVTPEATTAIINKVVPGITETMRAGTLVKTPYAMLSRAVAGIKGKCLIINLPGSPKAVQECLEIISSIIPHAIETLKGEVTEHTHSDAKKD